MEHIKMFQSHWTILSNTLFLRHQCLNCNNLQLFDVRLVRSRFSPCSGHQTVPKRSKFEGFRQPALLCLAQNVHRDPPVHLLIDSNRNCALWYARGSLCTFCARQSKAGWRKPSNFDRFGTVRWPEHGEKRDLTRRTSKSCKLLQFKHWWRRNKVLESIVQWLWNILICSIANLEHGCRITSEDKTVYWIGLRISCNPCLHIKEYQQEILYRTLAFEQLCSTVLKYSSGEVQQITHKGSIQLTILQS